MSLGRSVFLKVSGRREQNIYYTYHINTSRFADVYVDDAVYFKTVEPGRGFRAILTAAQASLILSDLMRLQ